MMRAAGGERVDRGATGAGSGRGAPIGSRELAYAGAFGAAGLLLPTIFHLLQLGHAFMPMYIPLMALAFLVSGRVSATTGFVVPLLSAAVTGMPPIYPPIALIMAIEIGAMAALIGAVRSRGSRPTLPLLLGALVGGRILNFGLSYLAALAMGLPPAFMAGLSFIAGWPGVLLMLVVIPPLVRLIGPGRPAVL
jgi:hypothetical protein